MILTMDRRTADVEAEATIDVENGTWTCVLHGRTMDIMGQDECPDCMNAVHDPPDYRLRRRG